MLSNPIDRATVIKSGIVAIVFVLLAALCTACFADNGLSLAAQHETFRRGSYVERVSGGLEDSGIATFPAAMAPPENDSHKWFLSVFSEPNCKPCEKLKRDLAGSKELQAFVNVGDWRKSAMHYHEFSSGDATQNWRMGVNRSTPAIVIQPPLSGKYGDPSNCLEPIYGYDGNAAALADTIRQRIRDYIEDLDKRSTRENASSGNDRKTPWDTNRQTTETEYDTEDSDVTAALGTLSTFFLTLLPIFQPGQLIALLLVVVVLIFVAYRAWRTDTGRTVYVPDAIAKQIENVAKLDDATIAAIEAEVKKRVTAQLSSLPSA
jgi:hypothetical protein